LKRKKNPEQFIARGSRELVACVGNLLIWAGPIRKRILHGMGNTGATLTPGKKEAAHAGSLY
jgi:hypothetical protein